MNDTTHLQEIVIGRALFTPDNILKKQIARFKDFSIFTDENFHALTKNMPVAGNDVGMLALLSGVSEEFILDLKNSGVPQCSLNAAITKLIAHSPGGAKYGTDSGAPREVELIQACNIQPESIVWLWNGWLPCGKLVILAGQPGTGKTTVMLSLAALITTGEVWPDGTRSAAGSVVMWSGEDGIADTLVPRLVAMSADMEKIFFVSGKGGSTFDPSKDLPLLAAQIKTVPDVKLVIVDPVVSAIGGDSHKNAEVRKGLQPLVDLGRDTGACIVGISHFNKSGGSTANPLDLVTGSIAFAAVARVVLGAAKLAAPEEGGHSRIFCRIKSNIGPDEDGVGYDLRMEFLNGRPEIEASVVTWGDYIKGHSRDLLSQVVEQKPNSALASAQEWLQKILADGPMPTTDVESAAERAGMSWSTVRRAKYGLGIRVCKDSDKVFGVWRWQLA